LDKQHRIFLLATATNIAEIPPRESAKEISTGLCVLYRDLSIIKCRATRNSSTNATASLRKMRATRATTTLLSAAAKRDAQCGISPVSVPPATFSEECGVHEVVQGQVLYHRHTAGQNGSEFERIQRRRVEDC